MAESVQITKHAYDKAGITGGWERLGSKQKGIMSADLERATQI